MKSLYKLYKSSEIISRSDRKRDDGKLNVLHTEYRLEAKKSFTDVLETRAVPTFGTNVSARRSKNRGFITLCELG